MYILVHFYRFVKHHLPKHHLVHVVNCHKTFQPFFVCPIATTMAVGKGATTTKTAPALQSTKRASAVPSNKQKKQHLRKGGKAVVPQQYQTTERVEVGRSEANAVTPHAARQLPEHRRLAATANDGKRVSQPQGELVPARTKLQTKNVMVLTTASQNVPHGLYGVDGTKHKPITTTAKVADGHEAIMSQVLAKRKIIVKQFVRDVVFPKVKFLTGDDEMSWDFVPFAGAIMTHLGIPLEKQRLRWDSIKSDAKKSIQERRASINAAIKTAVKGK